MYQKDLNGTFIAFGNLERTFPRMVSAIVKAYHVLPQPVIIQAGPNLLAFKSLPGVKVFRSCSSADFSGYVESANLLIIHGGVGASMEAILAGRRPAIFVRRANLDEHIDEHQADWCNILFENDLAIHATECSSLLDFVIQGKFRLENIDAAAELFDDSKLRRALHAEINLYLQR
jgi:UDP-N-acetylglucosamine transferase subunit ALG13